MISISAGLTHLIEPISLLDRLYLTFGYFTGDQETFLETYWGGLASGVIGL